MPDFSGTISLTPFTSPGPRCGKNGRDFAIVKLGGKKYRATLSETVPMLKPESNTRSGRNFFVGALVIGSISMVRGAGKSPVYLSQAKQNHVASASPGDKGAVLSGYYINGVAKDVKLPIYYNKSQMPLYHPQSVTDKNKGGMRLKSGRKYHEKPNPHHATSVERHSGKKLMKQSHGSVNAEENKRLYLMIVDKSGQDGKKIDRNWSRNRRRQQDDNTKRKTGNEFDWPLLPSNNSPATGERVIRSVPVKTPQATKSPVNLEDMIIISQLEKGIKKDYSLNNIVEILKKAFTEPVTSFTAAAIQLHEYIQGNFIRPQVKSLLRTLAEQLAKIESPVTSLHPVGLIRSSLGEIMGLIDDYLNNRPVDRNKLEAAVMDILNLRFSARYEDSTEYKGVNADWQTEYIYFPQGMKTFSSDINLLKEYEYSEGKVLWRDENEDLYLRIKESNGEYKYIHVLLEGDLMTVKEPGRNIAYGSHQKTYVFEDDVGWVYHSRAFRSLNNLPETVLKLSNIAGIRQVHGYPGVYFKESTNEYFLRIGQKNGQGEYMSVIAEGDDFVTQKIPVGDLTSFKKGGLSQTRFTYDKRMQIWGRSEVISPVFKRGIPKSLELKLSKELNLTPVAELPEIYRTDDGNTYLRTGNRNGQDLYIAGEVIENNGFQVKVPENYIQPNGASPVVYLFDMQKNQWKLDERLKGGGSGMSKETATLEGKVIHSWDPAEDAITGSFKVVADGMPHIGKRNVVHQISLWQAIFNAKEAIGRNEKLISSKNSEVTRIISEYMGIPMTEVSDDIYSIIENRLSHIKSARGRLATGKVGIAEVEHQEGRKTIASFVGELDRLLIYEMYFGQTPKKQLHSILHEISHIPDENGEKGLVDNYYAGVSDAYGDPGSPAFPNRVKTISTEEIFSRRRKIHRDIASGNIDSYIWRSQEKINIFIRAMKASSYDEAWETFKADKILKAKYIFNNADTFADFIMEIAELAPRQRRKRHTRQAIRRAMRFIAQG